MKNLNHIRKGLKMKSTTPRRLMQTKANKAMYELLSFKKRENHLTSLGDFKISAILKCSEKRKK